MRKYLLFVPVLMLLSACSGQTSTQDINAQQSEALNAIAANTAEDAGNDSAQDPARTQDAGSAYRAGANARPRKY